MIDIVEILIHWYAGRSQHELAAGLGVDRKTLCKYTAPARAAGIEPGGPPMGEGDWRALVTGWFPELADTGLRQVSWPRIDPCLLYTSPSPRDRQKSRMPSSA